MTPRALPVTATSEQRQRLVNAKREAIWARDAGCQQAVRAIEIVDGILEDKA